MKYLDAQTNKEQVISDFLKQLGPPPAQRLRVEDNLFLNREEYIQYIKNKAFEVDNITNLEFLPTELDFAIFEITQEDLPEIVTLTGRSLYEFYRARMIRVLTLEKECRL